MMSRTPSTATKLRNAIREQKMTRAELTKIATAAEQYRARATRAETEAAEWKRRFDLLLKREPAGLPPMPEKVAKSCICKPPVFGPNSITSTSADPMCPIHGGLMQNGASQSTSKGERSADR